MDGKYANRVMSGTWGEVWFDGDFLSEVKGFQAKVVRNTTDVKMVGQMWTDQKTISLTGNLSLVLHKVDSYLLKKLGDAFKSGKDPRFTLIGKLDDPDAIGAERVAIYNVSLNELTLMDWQAAVAGEVTTPGTFRGFDVLDAA